MIATIEPVGWVIVAMAGISMIGMMVWLVATMPDEWDPDAMEKADQPLGFRVIGPVQRPPFDWSEYPEFTAAAWCDEVIGTGYTMGDPPVRWTPPDGDDLDPEERWYALNDGWVQ